MCLIIVTLLLKNQLDNIYIVFKYIFSLPDAVKLLGTKDNSQETVEQINFEERWRVYHLADNQTKNKLLYNERFIKMKKATVILITIFIISTLCSTANAITEEGTFFEYYEYIPETDTELRKMLNISEMSSQVYQERVEIDASGNIETKWTPDFAGSDGYTASSRTSGISLLASTTDPDDYETVNTTTARPFRYLGVIRFYRTFTENGDPDWHRGSAFLEGPNVLVTAAHCCYNDKEGWTRDLYYYPARDGTVDKYTQAQRYSITVPSAWRSDGNNDYDWAIVSLKTAPGNTTGYFGKKWTSGGYVGTSVTMTGYPKTTDSTYSNYIMYTSPGTVSSNTNFKLYSTYNSCGGASGAPIYINQNGSYIAIGVHTGRSGELALGTRITEYFYNLLQEKLDEYLDSQA